MILDALRVLASASELLPSEYETLFCTSLDMASLNGLGIAPNRLQVKYVSRSEVQRLQSEADVLIAPLSHKNCSMAEVRTGIFNEASRVSSRWAADCGFCTV